MRIEKNKLPIKEKSRMNKFFSRYSHWLFFLVVGICSISVFINYNSTVPEMIAIIMGTMGMLAVGYLTIMIEKKYGKVEKNNSNSPITRSS